MNHNRLQPDVQSQYKYTTDFIMQETRIHMTIGVSSNL